MKISNELLAAYAEGKVTKEERNQVRQYLAGNPQELESVMMMMDEDYDIQLEGSHLFDHTDSFNYELSSLLDDVIKASQISLKPISKSVLPMMSMAAQNSVDNFCAIRCEGIALRKLGIEVNDDELIDESKKDGIIKEHGTALFNIGRLAGKRGLNVAHRYNCSIEDISNALAENDVVLAVVDSSELRGYNEYESDQDREGYSPNHVVVINSINEERITIIDTSSPSSEDLYPIPHFACAWDDSSNYLIIISKNNKYVPHPIDLSEVPISDDLLELREAIAENAHEVWAYNRMKDGWSYGSFRDDDKKLHPDLIPYNRLPESEKEYDREMAMNTIKLVQKLGWELKKKQS